MATDRIDIIGIAVGIIEQVLAEAYEAPIDPSECTRLALAVLVRGGVAQVWQARKFWHHLRTPDATIAGETSGYVRKSGLNSMVGAWYRASKRKEPSLMQRASMREAFQAKPTAIDGPLACDPASCARWRASATMP